MIIGNPEIINQTSWSEIGMFWTSMLMVLVTVTATCLNYLLLRTHRDPEVVVYACPDDDRPSIILLVIENLGPGVAKHVKFSTSEGIPSKAFGFEDAKKPNVMTSGPFISGIPSLGPNSKRVITWGQYGGLEKGIGSRTIEVTASYYRDRIVFPGKKEIKTKSLIDIESFEGTDASDKNWQKKTANELEKLAKTFGQAASGFKPIKIIIDEKN
ncbi:MAG: hypothetical protein HLX50_13635 [Alteromonadaceae bacterium]|nr:hypothetical protein [Alteromonadaceae bacterium]